MSNKNDRERKEVKNLFDDPKFARKAWRAVGNSIANLPAKKLPLQYDKDGNVTFISELEGYSYNALSKDIKKLGKEDREPTELELILYCQMVKARFDTAAAIFVRDTLGAKPVDESKVDQTVYNEFEHLSDEELELLANYRKQRELIDIQDNGSDAQEQDASSSLVDSGEQLTIPTEEE